MQVGELTKLIVKDLNDHLGLSVNTIVKISKEISDIDEFKTLASYIEERFKGLKLNYTTSSQDPINPPKRISKLELTPQTPKKKRKGKYSKQYNKYIKKQEDKYKQYKIIQPKPFISKQTYYVDKERKKQTYDTDDEREKEIDEEEYRRKEKESVPIINA